MNGVRISRTSVQCALVLACITMSEAVFAQEEALKPQFLAELEYGSVALQGRELDYAFVDPTGSLSGGGAIQRLDPDSEQIPRFRVGWQIPGKSSAWLEARFFTWEGGASDSTGTRTSSVGALLASPDFAIGRSLVDRADARSSHRANSYSVFLRWSLRANSTGPSIDVAAGVRGVRFEEERLVTYRATRFESRLRELISAKQDLRAWGPAVEGRIGGSFGSRVQLGGTLEAAFLLGRIDIDAIDQSFVDDSFDRATIATRDDQRRDVLVIGGALWLEVAISRRVSFGASYRYERWSGVSDQVRFVDDVSQNSAIIVEGRATLTGPALSLRMTW